MIEPLHRRELNRARGRKHWSSEDETRLVALAAAGRTSAEIAADLNRSFSSVQHRLKKVGASVARRSEKRSDQSQAAVDLTCGAITNSGQQIVQAERAEIRSDQVIAKRPLFQSDRDA